MTKFRNLPIEVEAEQFLYSAASWPEGVYQSQGGMFLGSGDRHMQIKDRDWIISFMGEKYAMRPELFLASFEMMIDPVDPPEFATTIDPVEIRKPPKGPQLT